MKASSVSPSICVTFIGGKTAESLRCKREVLACGAFGLVQTRYRGTFFLVDDDFGGNRAAVRELGASSASSRPASSRLLRRATSSRAISTRTKSLGTFRSPNRSAIASRSSVERPRRVTHRALQRGWRHLWTAPRGPPLRCAHEPSLVCDDLWLGSWAVFATALGIDHDPVRQLPFRILDSVG